MTGYYAGLNRVITVQRPDVFSYSRKLFKRVVDRLDKKTLRLKDSKNWTHTYQSSTNLFHKLVEEMRSKECIGCFDSLSAGDLKLWKDMARLYLSSGYVELAGNLPWKLTQKIVTHQESGRSFDIPLWVPLCAVITKNHHAYFSEVDQDGDTIVNLFHNGARPVNPYLIRLNLLSYVERRRRCDVDILRKCYDKLFVDRELEGVAVAFNHALFKLLKLGIHLTQVTPRCSVGLGGGLPARPTRIRVSLCERGGLPRLSVRLALARGFPLSKVWA